MGTPPHSLLPLLPGVTRALLAHPPPSPQAWLLHSMASGSQGGCPGERGGSCFFLGRPQSGKRTGTSAPSTNTPGQDSAALREVWADVPPATSGSPVPLEPCSAWSTGLLDTSLDQPGSPVSPEDVLRRGGPGHLAFQAGNAGLCRCTQGSPGPCLCPRPCLPALGSCSRCVLSQHVLPSSLLWN